MKLIRATAHASVFVRAIEEHTLRAQYEHSNDTWPENIWKTGNIYHLQHCLMSTLFQIWSEQTQRFLGERSTFVRECKSLSSKQRFLREHNIFERESKVLRECNNFAREHKSCNEKALKNNIQYRGSIDVHKQFSQIHDISRCWN